uniref:Lipase n=1 Tax=Ditylenchus dipsaci TaxID=166011 RepID=A0A915DCE4_9BILA
MNTVLALAVVFFLAHVVQASPARSQPEKDVDMDKKSPASRVEGPLTEHFMDWLQSNGYADYDFAYTHMGSQASFGGKSSHEQQINQHPVIFIHGNSDGALDLNDADVSVDPSNMGWSASIEQFLENGYSTAELYAITYGDRQIKNSIHRSMDCQTVVRLRRFVEAVMEYTNASYVDIIAHSMGVSLARRIIKGGNMREVFNQTEVSECYIGHSLHQKVHTFIGIAGANYGMCLCSDEKLARSLPACGKMNGFWAGSCGPVEDVMAECSSPIPTATLHCGTNFEYSNFLSNLNNDSTKEGKIIISMWSSGDTILGKTNFSWGKMTSIIPGSDRLAQYTDLSHYEVKTKTSRDQYLMISASHFVR